MYIGVNYTGKEISMTLDSTITHDLSPKFVFLDICTIEHLNAHLKDNSKFKETADRLKKHDKTNNIISLFYAICENTTKLNKNNTNQYNLTDEQLIKKFKNYLSTLNEFFKKATKFERNFPLEEMLQIVRNEDVDAKLDDDARKKFLIEVNKLELHNKNPSIRFQRAKLIIEEAKKQKINTNHPVVLSSVAYVYDCQPAIGVMKFKSPKKFDYQNAFDDIATISRLSSLFSYLPLPYHTPVFITDDKSLEILYSYFNVSYVTQFIQNDKTYMNFNFKADYLSLFPALFSRNENNEIVYTTKQKEETYELLKLIDPSSDFQFSFPIVDD